MSTEIATIEVLPASRHDRLKPIAASASHRLAQATVSA